MQSTHEYSFNCPYCGDHISVILETFAAYITQHYTEDCEICCRPIEISYSSSEFEIEDFRAGTTDE